MNAKQIAKELEVSRRTVHRDLNALELAKVPFCFDRETGGYQILHDFFLPPVNLTLGEAMALSLMASEIGRLKQVPLLEQAWQGMMKVRSQLPASIQDQLFKADKTVRIRTAAASPQGGSTDLLLQISNAITARRKLSVIYESSANQNDLQPFLYRPYCLYYGQRAWYVIGYSERAGAERTLKLGRLRKTETTDRPYSIPDEWSLEKTFGKAWRMMRGDRRYDVAIEFIGDCARTMADTMWHPGQKIIWKSSECCLFECEVDGLDEIVWWILSYGQHAKVLRPKELVRRVQEQLVSAARQYGVSDESAPESIVLLSRARIGTRKPVLQSCQTAARDS